MPSLAGRILLLLCALATLGGCLKPVIQAATPKPPAMSADSVALEIFFVRFPLGDPQINGPLWQEVDEQQFPADLRQRLARNGFRAGLLGGHVPDALSKLLALQDKPPTDKPQQTNVAEAGTKPRVTLRHLQTRAKQRNEILASPIHDRLPVLMSESGELRGQTYTQAQGVLAAAAAPLADGRVRLEIVPEIHHDQARQHWVGDQAAWRLETGRPKRAFDDLKISAVMAPGTMLLLTTQPDRPGSLGHYFFTEGDGHDSRLEQTLILVRLCQTQHNDVVASPVLPLGE